MDEKFVSLQKTKAHIFSIPGSGHVHPEQFYPVINI